MEELKLECLVEGYEGTYFEVGQVWETRVGDKYKVIEFDYEDSIYKVKISKVEDSTFVNFYTQKGQDWENEETEDDLVRLISTETPTESTLSEEPQPKTLSEYLKENNAYESFVENCVESFLGDKGGYHKIKLENDIIYFGNAFNWRSTEQGNNYWYNLHNNLPKNLIYDMNEIVFAEVDKRIAEQKSSTKYMVFVEGRKAPKVTHDCIASARREASRLSAKEVGLKVSVVEIVKTFKSKVIVEEV